MTINEFLDIQLKELSEKEWAVLEVTIRKHGDTWDVATGGEFGPYLQGPRVIPDEPPKYKIMNHETGKFEEGMASE